MIKAMLVIIAVVACVAVAHPQNVYPAAFSYQSSFVHHDPPRPYVDRENRGMDRFRSAEVSKQSAPQRFSDRETPDTDRFRNAQVTKQSEPQRFEVRENQGMDGFTKAQITEQSAPRRFVEKENQGMDRFTNSHYNKQSNFRQRENSGGNAAYTAQRRNDYNDRDRFENFNAQY